MRLAIIGGGISGLSAAWGLHQQHDLTLFEASNWLGGHAHTVDVEGSDGQTLAIDTGFIVYNDATYPHLIRLLEQLGLSRQATDMSFSVVQGHQEYASHSLSGLFANRRSVLSLPHLQMIRDILRFNKQSLELIGSNDPRTLDEYLSDQSYCERFRSHYLFPLCAAIWSASIEDARQFPAEHFVRFFNNHGLLQLRGRPQWRVVPGGSRAYVRALQQRLNASIYLDTPIKSVRRSEQGVSVCTADGEQQFDQVIFACHSDQALHMLDDASDAEKDILGALPYTDNDVVLHTDVSVLPANRRAWASWNFRAQDDPTLPAAITYHMNRLQGLSDQQQYCVTLNQTDRIAPAHIIDRYTYAHPVYMPSSNAARERRNDINGFNNTWYCGAYWYNGFHEDGARSGLDVAQAFGGGW